MADNEHHIEIGAIVCFPCKFIHPHRHRDAKFPDRYVGQRLTNARVVQRTLKKINHKKIACVIVHHKDFKDDEGNNHNIWCCESHVRVEQVCKEIDITGSISSTDIESNHSRTRTMSSRAGSTLLCELLYEDKDSGDKESENIMSTLEEDAIPRLNETLEQAPRTITEEVFGLSRRMNLRQTIQKTEMLNKSNKFINAKNTARYGHFRLPPFTWVAIPSFISLWYACAILFPPEARDKAPLLLWTDGELTRDDERFTEVPVICPRASICSVGVFQIILISLARLSAFASYVVMGLTFVTKMHSSIHFLANSYASYFIPFEKLHDLHRYTGLWYAGLALLHTVTHFIRYAVRNEIADQMKTQPAISGIFAFFAMFIVVCSMTVAKRVKWLSFEHRFNFHWFFLLLAVALCFHTARTRTITLIFFGLWTSDYLYSRIFRIHRLDVVEFMPLPEEGGTQMLWHNPKGFKSKSGEFVKVKIPWLKTGGNEWHPFSLYLREATEKGLQVVNKKENGRIYLGDESKGGREVNASKTAVLLIEFQNEFCSPSGKLYNTVRSVLQSNGMLKKTASLANVARKAGAQVFHAPFVYKDAANPNANMGIMKSMRNKSMFIEDSWGADFFQMHKPQPGDNVIKNKNGIDCFTGTNLEDLILEKGIETLIVCGLITNACVESTIRQAYEKGINVISLTDGTACKSLQEQKVATEMTYPMFSTTMTCADAVKVLRGEKPKNLDFFPQVEKEDSSANPLEALTLEQYIEDIFDKPAFGIGNDGSNYLVETARKDINKQYDTTQIFIAPAGDWSKGVTEDIKAKNHGRSCWVSGPFTSPYSVASGFSHLVLMASGIGITPALGVMGQFPDSSRTKVLVWSIRSRSMLKFFAPLLCDAHLAVVFYTGKEKLTPGEVRNISKEGNIFLQQSRPESLTDTIGSIITLFEREVHSVDNFVDVDGSRGRVKNIDLSRLAAWCILYCGGSVLIKDMLHDFAKSIGTGWDCELFDW